MSPVVVIMVSMLVCHANDSTDDLCRYAPECVEKLFGK